jgi:3-isopropylmalate/(R)-2-methylmalate dehydratase small subunit
LNTPRKVWRLPKDVNTDNLAPGAYMKLPVAEIARHTLESVRPEFASSVVKGDVIVAGANFGIGSSREQAAGVLLELGVGAVIAPSFSGLFFRNAFNLGLLLLTCSKAELIGEEHTVRIRQQTKTDAAQGKVHTFWIQTDAGEELECMPIPDFLMQMIDQGGLLNVLKLKR